MDINLLSEDVAGNQTGESRETFLTSSHETEVEEYHQIIKRRFNFRQLVRWVVYAVVGITPLLFLPWTSEIIEFNKQSLLIIASSIGLVFYLVDVVQRGVARIRISNLYLPLGGFMVVSLVVAILSSSPYQSFLGNAGSPLASSFATWFSLAVVFFLAINVIEDEGKMLRRIITGSFGLIFLMALLQLLGVTVSSSSPFNNYAFNTVSSMNGLAMLAALLWPLFWAEQWIIAKKIPLAKIVAFLALFLLIIVNWWPVWSVAFAAIIAWMTFSSFERGRLKTSAFMVPMIVIVIGIFTLLINFTVPVLRSRLPAEVVPGYGASLKIAIKVLNEKPISGYGQGNFAFGYEKFKPEGIARTIFSNTRFNQAPSGFLTLAVEGGILMILALVFFIAYTIREAIHSKSRHAFLSVAALVSYFLLPSGITALLILFLGAVFLELNSPRTQEKVFELETMPSYSLISSGIFVASLVICLIGSYFIIVRYIGDVHYAKALSSGKIDDAIAKTLQAININAQNPRHYVVLSQELLIKLSQELGDVKDKSAEKSQRIQNLTASAVDAALRANQISPDDSQMWLNRAIVYQNLIGLVTDADKVAIDVMNEVFKRDPNNPAAYQRLGSIYFTIAENNRLAIANATPEQRSRVTQADIKNLVNDKLIKSEENYRKVIELNPNIGQAVYDLGVVYERQSKLGEAVKQFERLVQANPKEAGLSFTLGLLYYRNNQKDAAFGLFRRAVDLVPNYSNARWYLSLMYEERGDLPGALIQAEEILKLNPDIQQVQERVDQLRAGIRLIPPAKVLNQKPL